MAFELKSCLLCRYYLETAFNSFQFLKGRRKLQRSIGRVYSDRRLYSISASDNRSSAVSKIIVYLSTWTSVPWRQKIGHPDFMTNTNGKILKIEMNAVEFKIATLNDDVVSIPKSAAWALYYSFITECWYIFKGDKCRREEEQKQRITTNQSAAGSSYTPVRFNEGSRTNPEGLPWGSYALTGIGSGTSTKTDSNAYPKSYANVQKASQNPQW